MINPDHTVMPLNAVKWVHNFPFSISPINKILHGYCEILRCKQFVRSSYRLWLQLFFLTFRLNVPFMEVMCFCIHSGPAVFPECSINRCSVRCVGPEVLPAAHCILHLCSHSSHEDQPMVNPLHKALAYWDKQSIF